MFTALVLLFIVIMLVVIFARVLSQRPSQRYPDYPDAQQMPPQMMQATQNYNDPYSDTGYYQPGSSEQSYAAPPPKEADAYEQGYTGYASRSEPGATPRADESDTGYEERTSSAQSTNYDPSYYRPGSSNTERRPEHNPEYGQRYDEPAQAAQCYEQQAYGPYQQGAPFYPQQRPYGPQYPPSYQQPYGPQDPQAYQQLYYGPYPGPYPPQQRSGMNPWVAGGLGALMGYGLGNTLGQQQGHDEGSTGGDMGVGGDFGGGDF
ncbi:hypothetical protein [Ktedonobacter racemifer]|uniref:Uncharacterized protein n=1 Tax=Ktedonobacter racemifer DSM 44963 TaxID=485913 RepID=D6U2U1_KTERA|nr:hypothetical protein [Ktedonobacter racemifer]EFH82846.1 hypothetical protein Krac_3706 [Ktedonobacter racemifer DSM 44963]